MGLLTLAIYLGLSLTSDAIVADSVYSVGISICVYYIVAALSSVFYFHRTAFGSVRTAFGQVLLPLDRGGRADLRPDRRGAAT